MLDGNKDDDAQEHVEDNSATVADDGDGDDDNTRWHSMPGSEVFRAGPFDLGDRLWPRRVDIIAFVGSFASRRDHPGRELGVCLR